MEKNKIKRFYIMPEVWVTVTQSQVFNWIKLLSNEGIETDCISITSSKNKDTEIKQIEESISGKFIEIHNHKRLFINDLYLSFILLKYYFKSVFKYEKIIFQTRLSSIGFTFTLLKWLPKAKFIFESRAATNEERIHTSMGRKKTLKLKIKNSFSERSERLMITKSHRVFCVSNSLIDYYLKKYNMKGDKFTVFPGAADSELFYDQQDLRVQVRKELGLKYDEIVVVYSGRLEMKWEIPDKIFEFFKDLQKRDARFRLLLVTPDVELANEMISDYKLEQSTFVRKVTLEEVNKFLNCSDVGLLLREDIPMNNVASPTKFAEYLMAGIPVIISHGVHDFANNIDETGYGTVVSGLGAITQSEYEKLQKSLTIDRKTISSWGLNNLSKHAFIKKYASVLKDV